MRGRVPPERAHNNIGVGRSDGKDTVHFRRQRSGLEELHNRAGAVARSGVGGVVVVVHFFADVGEAGEALHRDGDGRVGDMRVGREVERLEGFNAEVLGLLRLSSDGADVCRLVKDSPSLGSLPASDSSSLPQVSGSVVSSVMSVMAWRMA